MAAQKEQNPVLTDMLVIPQQIELSNYVQFPQQMVQVIAYFLDDTDGLLVQIQVEHDPQMYTILLSPSTPEATFCYMSLTSLDCRYRYRREIAAGVFGAWSCYRSADHPLVVHVHAH